MTKKEFLDKLGEALLENMDVSEAMSHVQYYKEYIESEVSKGKTEKEVIATLQSPRLIAKNIIHHVFGYAARPHIRRSVPQEIQHAPPAQHFIQSCCQCGADPANKLQVSI